MKRDVQNKINGFTLIELSISMLVVGILIVAVLTPYTVWKQNEIRQTTENNLDLVNQALNEFLASNGRYPCPARLDLPRTDPNYGLEYNCDPTTDFQGETGPMIQTPGTLVNGIYYEQSNRGPMDIDLTSPGMLANALVRRGAVPFRTLQLDELQGIDGYRNLLQYAVTDNLANPNTFNNKQGAISIIDDSGNSRVSPDHSAHYFLFSSGKNQAGAYGRDGIMIEPCGTGTSESENCNTATTGGNDRAVYAVTERNEAAGATFYDDDARYFSSKENPLWITMGDTRNVNDLIDATDGGAMIGIGTDTPQHMVDVSGNIRVEDSSAGLETSALTDDADAEYYHVFDHEKYAHPTGHDDYDCPQIEGDANAHITGLSNNGANCDTNRRVKCPDGYFVSGFTENAGEYEISCEAFTGCPSRDVTICGSTATLPSKGNGVQITLGPYGDSRHERWQCYGDTWYRNSRWGICTCDSGMGTVTDFNQPCNAYMGEGYWLGTVDVTTETSCSGSTTVTIPPAQTNNCVCDPQTGLNDLIACNNIPGENYNNTALTQREWDWNCASASSGSWSGYRYPNAASVCTCTADIRPVTSNNCGSPYMVSSTSPAIQRREQFNCTTGTWDLMPFDAGQGDYNNCTCDAGRKIYTTLSCPPGKIGDRVFEQEVACDAMDNPSLVPPNPTDNPPITNTCADPSYTWVPTTPPQGPYSPQNGQKANSSCLSAGSTSNCWSPASGGLKWHYDECVCE